MFDQPKTSSTKTDTRVPQTPIEEQRTVQPIVPGEITTPLPMPPRVVSWPPEPHDYRYQQRISPIFRGILAALALLLIFSGLGLIIYSSSRQYGAALHKREAAREAATSAVSATANANIQGTAHIVGTMQSSIEATATAIEQGSNQTITSADNATAIANEFISQYSQDASGPAALENPLIKEKGPGGWDEGQNRNTKNGCTYRSGQYRVTEGYQGYLQPCVAEQTSFRDMLYQSAVMLATGETGQAGLLFRINQRNTAYYFFSISSMGTYRLELYTAQGDRELLSEGESSSIIAGRGKDNLLGVLVQGQTYALFINGAYVGSASNGSLRGGKIGVAVLDRNAPIDASFHDIQVWNG